MRYKSQFDPSRRGVLRSMVAGSLLMPGIVSHLLTQDAKAENADNPLAVRPTHFPPKAKRVIFLYMDRTS